MPDFHDLLCEWRHTLHQTPETAFEEVKTAAFVAEKLAEMGYTVHTGIGGTGIVADLTVGDGKRIVGLRADMDAINLAEQGEPAYRSNCPGKMHGCGHDGHTVALLGAAKLLSERKDFNGTVRLVFQPAEEPGRGAQAMIDDGLLSKYPLDEIYGVHNMPAVPAGSLYTRVGGIMSSEDNFTIVIHGKGGHASAPNLGIDPLIIAAEIILALQSIVSRNVNPADPAVVSCTELHTDGAHNAIPSNVTITGDTRSCTPEVQRLIEERMRSICMGVCAMHNATCDFTYTHEFRPTVNWKECTQAMTEAASNILGASNVDGDCKPWMGSEDFAAFLEKVPGCFAFLGSGTDPVATNNTPLHNAWFDYNDDVLVTGAEIFAEIIRLRLPR